MAPHIVVGFLSLTTSIIITANPKIKFFGLGMMN